MKYLYGLTYKNRGSNTNMSYKQSIYTSKREAVKAAKRMSPWVKKTLKVARLVLKPVE